MFVLINRAVGAVARPVRAFSLSLLPPRHATKNARAAARAVGAAAEERPPRRSREPGGKAARGGQPGRKGAIAAKRQPTKGRSEAAANTRPHSGRDRARPSRDRGRPQEAATAGTAALSGLEDGRAAARPAPAQPDNGTNREEGNRPARRAARPGGRRSGRRGQRNAAGGAKAPEQRQTASATKAGAAQARPPQRPRHLLMRGHRPKAAHRAISPRSAARCGIARKRERKRRGRRRRTKYKRALT